MPDKELRHLTTAAVVAIHAEVLKAHGGQAGLRDERLLESAVAAPQATFDGKPLMTDVLEVGAAYLFYLCRNHPFVDGNKRTALAACLVFLAANGRLPDPAVTTRDPDAWESFIQDLAGSRLDRLQTTRRLKQLLARRLRPRARR